MTWRGLPQSRRTQASGRLVLLLCKEEAGAREHSSTELITKPSCDVARQAASVRVNDSEPAAARSHNIAFRIRKLGQENMDAWCEAVDGQEAAV